MKKQILFTAAIIISGVFVASAQNARLNKSAPTQKAMASTGFYVSPDTVTCPNDALSFSSYNYSATSYSWNFGDGQSSTGSYYTYHAYATPGNYTVQLYETDQSGTQVYSKTIVVSKSLFPNFSINLNWDVVCINETLESLYGIGNQAKSYSWDFGDGSTATAVQPIKQYTVPGVYTITLTETNGCSNSATNTRTVNVRNDMHIRNTAYVYLNPNPPVCPNTDILFGAPSGYSNYSWSFGDGQTASGTSSNASHKYTAPGNYNGVLVITNGCGLDTTLTGTVPVVAYQPFPPTSGVTAYPAVACPGTDINLYANPQNEKSYYFDFGDGTNATTTSNNINHKYTAFGNYTATVKISNGCGNDTTVSTLVVIDNSTQVPQNLYFNSSADTICVGSSVSFSASNDYNEYKWNFGDGDSTNTGPYSYSYHNYTLVGNYTASVTIKNGCGSSRTFTKTIVVNLSAPLKNLALNPQNQSGCPNDLINFNSDQGLKTYVWNFGDGSPVDSSAHVYVLHGYTTPNTYTVTLTAYNNCNKSKTVKSIITIGNSFPIQGAYVNAYPQKACPGSEIRVSTRSGMQSYIWNFGDGTPSDTSVTWDRNHKYIVPGTYTVSVRMFNNCLKDTTVSTVVSIDPQAGFPNNLSIYQPDPVCNGDAINFNAPYGYAAYIWNFGDGSGKDSTKQSYRSHLYSNIGTYTVSVKIFNLCGKDTTIYGQAIVSNSIHFPSNMTVQVDNPNCPSAKVHMNTQDGYANYSWDFGDNTSASGQSYANHVYPNPGTYTVSVHTSNTCGFDTTVTGVVIISNAADFPQNNISMYGPNTAVCPGDEIRLSASRDYASYLWRFSSDPADTVRTSSEEVFHTYNTPGVYQASVTITNFCGKKITLFTPVLIDQNTPINQFAIQAPQTPICAGDDIGLYVSDGLPSYSYSWNFGDGSTAQTIGGAPRHKYATNGTYTITVKATNGCGKSATTTAVVVVNSGAKPVLGNESFGVAGGEGVNGCPGDAVLFYCRNSEQVVWDFGDGSPAVQATEKIEVEGFSFFVIKHAYASAGSYWAKIKVTNGCGNSTTDSLKVSLQGGLLANGELFIATPPGNGGYSTCTPVTLIATGGQTYDFNFGDGSTKSSTSPNVSHAYTQAGNYVASVTITNGCGYKASYAKPITVNSTGGISATATPVQQVSCNGGNNGSAIALATAGASPFTYSWNNGQTASAINNLFAGTYTVTITDNIGCSGSATVVLTNGLAPNILASTTATACGTNTGTASLTASGGASPYSFVWSNNRTGASVSNLAAGNYTVTTTDNNGCSGTGIVTINASNGATVTTASTTNITCVYGTNGSVDINVSGGATPYTYSWSNGNTSQDLNGVGAGNYVLQVTDNGNCKTVHNVSIAAPSEVSTSSSVVGADCGKFNGSGTVSASGGTGPYTYLWDVNAGSKTTATVTGLPAGNYTVITTDNVGCKDTSEVVINNPNAPNVSGTVTNAACYGQSNGSVGLNINGGTSPYLITWIFSGSHAANLTNLSKNVYTVSVQDASGCLVYKNFSVDEPNALTATINVSNTISVRNTGSATVTTTGGNSTFTYSWSNNASSQTISDLAVGTYSVTVTDNKGCSASASKSIVVEAVKQEICIVDVNHAYNQNEVIWTRMPGMGTKGYNIYRELNSGGGIYSKVNATLIDYSAPTNYLDTASGIDPDKRSYRYRITTVDSSDNESEQSEVHKTMHFTASQGSGNDINLAWDNYEGVNYTSYILYEGTSLQNVVPADTFPSNLNGFTYTPKVTGNGVYFVKINAPNTCSDNKSYNDSKSNTAVLGVIGINQAEAQGLKLDVYPNPASETMTISFVSPEKQQVILNVMNSVGQIVYNEQLGVASGKATKQLFIYNWPSGIYYIQLVSNNGVTTHKINVN